MKLATGTYNLEKWRRAAQQSLNKARHGNQRPRAPGEGPTRNRGKKGGQQDKNKLNNIVNKILASKTNDDIAGGIMAGSDQERSDNSDNYNIYG